MFGTEFYFTVWLGVTAALLFVGLMLVAVARTVVDPVAVELAVRPGRVLKWVPILAVALPASILILFLTFVGAPLAIVVMLIVPLGGGLGLIALGLTLGDRLLRAVGMPHPPLLAVALGVITLRLVRLIPFVGAPLSFLLLWFCCAAAAAVLYDVSVSYYRRRLPDNIQFSGDNVIEWNPEEGEQSSIPRNSRDDLT